MMTRILFALGLVAGCSSTPGGSPDLGLVDRALAEARSDVTRDDGTRPAELRPSELRAEGPLKADAGVSRWEIVPGQPPKVDEHAAVLLKDGRVLIVGGRPTKSSVTAEAYLYDPTSNAFQKAAPMATARSGHSATLLGDGRVLVAGGQAAGSTGALDSTELYDPAAATWSAGPLLPGPRAGHRAILFANGDLLLVGGYSKTGQLASLVLLPSGAKSFVLLAAAMSAKRAGHTAALLANGKVVIAGGYDGTSYLDTLEIFDPASGPKQLPAKLSEARAQATATRLSDGKVLIVGGQHCTTMGCTSAQGDDLFDPATDTILPVAHPGGAPAQHAAAALLDGRVLVSGGFGAGTKAALYASGGLGGWSLAPPLKGPRYGHTSSTLLDGSVLVVGGQESEGVLAQTAERFFP